MIANDVNIYGVKVVGSPTGGTLTLNANGTFTFAARAATGSFQYCGNGATSGAACTTVTLGAAPSEADTNFTLGADAYKSKVATTLSIKRPGVLGNDADNSGYPLTVNAVTGGDLPACVGSATSNCVAINPDGSFNAYAAVGTHHFSYNVKSARGTVSSASADVTLDFPAGSGLVVKLVDGKSRLTPVRLPLDH